MHRVVLMVLVLAACGGDGDPAGADAPPADAAAAGCDAGGWTALERLSPEELDALLGVADPVLLNVHVPWAGDIPGTDGRIAYTDVDAIEAFVGGDRCADLVLYCLSGPMSVAAGTELIARGYLRVRDLEGGLDAWERAGYPVEP